MMTDDNPPQNQVTLPSPETPQDGNNWQNLPMMTDDNPSQNQVPPPTSETPQDDIDWRNPPKKRVYPRLASIIIFIVAAAGIIAYGIFEKTVTLYEADNDNSTIKLANITTGTITCYTKKGKITYPVFFNLSLGLMGIMLGSAVVRLSLFIHELFQLQSRYNGDICKAFGSCFSGVSWKAVAAVFGLVVLFHVLGRDTPFQLVDVIYILGGIGVGPLLIQLLNLNTESKVDVSIILEAMEMYPGHTLAWSYYFNHLKPAVREFCKAITDHQTRPSASCSQDGKELSLNKLLLLLPPTTDLTDITTLISYDGTIAKLEKGNRQNPYPFHVYEFAGHENRIFAMMCLKEPIVALRKMKTTTNVKFVTDDTYEDELKRFYKTLCEIIKNPPHDECAMMGLVVPITLRVGKTDELRRGGLSRIIIEKVNAQPESNDCENQSCCFCCGCCCFCCRCCCSRVGQQYGRIPPVDERPTLPPVEHTDVPNFEEQNDDLQ